MLLLIQMLLEQITETKINEPLCIELIFKENKDTAVIIKQNNKQKKIVFYTIYISP